MTEPRWLRSGAAARVLVGLVLTVGAPSTAPAQDPGVMPPSNRVLELDGEGAHVELPVAAFEGLREATVEAWVRWDSWDSFSQWFAYGTDNVWRSMGVNHWSVSPILQFFIYHGTAQELSVIDVQAALPLGTWHHMAAVSGTGGMRLYLDGALMGSDAHAGSFAALGEGTGVYLGRSPWADNAPFRGGLDEVRLWSVARDVDQIRADMARPLRGDETGLAGLWNFDAGDARDGSSHGHHGILRDGSRCEAAPYPGATSRLWPALVRGQVRDDDGELAGARVLLVSRSDTVEASSDQTGDFSVAVLDTGMYTVTVLGNDRRVPRREVSVTPGADLYLDLRPPPPNLLARWSAEGDARDEMGQHDAVGDVSFAPGVVGQAFRFDGSRSGALQVPNSPDLNPRGSFSIVAWILPEDDQEMAVIDLWGDVGDWDHQRAYSLRLLPGRRVSLAISDSLHQEDGAYHNLLTRPNVLPLNAWSLVAAVWDAASGERRVYVNGRLVARRTDLTGLVARSRADLGIATHMHGLEQTVILIGRIDELSLYGEALSEDSIARLYSTYAQARWPAEGNANDGTRSGHDGVAIVNASFAPGVVGQAFAFDSRDSYIEFDPRIGNYGDGDFGIELWLRCETLPTDERPILTKGDAGVAAFELLLEDTGNVAATLVGRQDSLRLVGGTSLIPGTWHHVVLIRESRLVRIYLDGELDGSVTTAATIELQTPSPLLLGGRPGAPSFAGRIDEVALHRRVPAADEIQATYQRVEAEWRGRVWRDRLRAWGLAAAGLLGVLAAGRAVWQRRARRREREQLAEAHRAREAADAANEAKSAFLANMSHEIRTPMNAIMGHAQMLRDDESLDEGQLRSAAAICDHGGLLLGLIDDILDLSKSEAGRMELQPGDFDLGQLIDSLQVLFEVRCRQKGLQLRVDREPVADTVRGDETKLRQVLVNLLGNAVKFTDRGEVILVVSKVDKQYVFEVIDTGPGIAPEFQQFMFEPFQQGSSGLASGGTGLGLSIAQRHVALMGGRLVVTSAPGEGACFSFRVPLETVSRALASAASAEEVAPADRLALPPALRSRLREASQMHNVTEVKRCLDDMRDMGEREAQLAMTLDSALKRFDLAPLIEALENTVDADVSRSPDGPESL